MRFDILRPTSTFSRSLSLPALLALAAFAVSACLQVNHAHAQTENQAPPAELPSEQDTALEAAAAEETPAEVEAAEEVPAEETPEEEVPAEEEEAAEELPAEEEPTTEVLPADLENPAEQTPAAKPLADKAVKLEFSFRYAPWKDVLEWFADEADLSLVYEALPPGTFNYTDNRAYTPAEAIDLINSVLLTKGYTLVRHRRMLILHNLEDGIDPNLVTTIKAEELEERGSYELVSVLFNVTRKQPEEMELEISKLLGPQGKVIVLPQAKQVFVTETAGRLKTIRDVIEAIENPTTSREGQVQVFTLEHVTADEALAVARPLLGIPAEQFSTPDESLRISLDLLGGRMLVSGSEESTAKLSNILELVDVPSGAAGATTVETPQLEVYSVGSSDPATVLRVMQTLLAGEPGVRLESDESTGNLVALARPSHHATIRATLDQMARDGREIEVIQLAYIDPQVAMLSINKLFGGGGEEPNASAPKVEADPITGQLLIRGSQVQIEQIRNMLQKMGETGESPSQLANASSNSRMRTINLSGYGARTALEQIQALWPSMHQNRIRVITPSAGIQEKRPNAEPGTDGPPRVDSGDPSADWLKLFPFGDTLPRAGENNAGGNAGGNDRRAPPANRQPMPTAEPPAAEKPELERAEGKQAQSSAATRRIPAQFAQALFQQPPAQPTAPAAQPPGEQATEEEIESVPGADIIVAPGPGGIVIASDDLEALDEFEYLLQTIADQLAAAGSQYTVFYLKYAEAPQAAALLQEVLGAGGGDTGGTGGGGGGLLGGLASAAMGGGGDMFGDLLGLGGGGGGGLLSSSSSLTITADTRLNALVVQGTPADVDMVEQMLEIIDQENSPEDVETLAKPRLIPVFNTNASDVAQVVQQVYSQRIASAGGGGNQRQPSPEEFIKALRGGGGGRNRSSEAEQQKMTIGVDTRSNSIVVAAPDPLFDQVRALVEQLDQAVEETNQTVQVVQLRRATPEVMQKALNSVLGNQAQSNTTSAASSNNSNNDSDDDNRRRSEEFRDQMRQRMEAFNAMQRGDGGGGRGRGGRGGR